MSGYHHAARPYVAVLTESWKNYLTWCLQMANVNGRDDDGNRIQAPGQPSSVS